MNVIKCANGHFFDADTYKQCPQCGAEPAAVAAKGGKEKTEHRSFSLFGQKHNKTVSSPVPEKKPVSQTPPKMPEKEVHQETPSVPTDSGYAQVFRSEVYATQNTPVIPENRKKDVTVDFWQATTSQLPDEPETPKKDVTVDFWQSSVTQTSAVPELVTAEEPVVNAVTTTQDTAASAPTVDALREAVRAASASSEGKTMSYFSAVAPATPVAASAEMPASAAAAPVRQNTGDPVVGWLVCIQGPCLGWSFQIGAGNNSIGRKDENRIVIPSDMKISGIRHATITYEPKRRNFFLQPGEASGLTYLNDEYIDSSKKLSHKDIIEMGDTRLLFVPLCGEDFSWETYIK